MQPDVDVEFKYPPDDFDYALLHKGAMSLFYKPEVLQEAISWFQERQYAVSVLDAATWRRTEDFHKDVARSLNFPEYYGRNLNALNDLLRYVEVPVYSGREQCSSTSMHFFTNTLGWPAVSWMLSQLPLGIFSWKAESSSHWCNPTTLESSWSRWDAGMLFGTAENGSTKIGGCSQGSLVFMI